MKTKELNNLYNFVQHMKFYVQMKKIKEKIFEIFI